MKVTYDESCSPLNLNSETAFKLKDFFLDFWKKKGIKFLSSNIFY